MPGLGSELGDGQTQGQVHRDSQGILRQKHVEVVVAHEREELLLEMRGDFIDAAADSSRPA